MWRVVVDTNVLIGGLSRRGAAGSVVDAWVEGRIKPCVSTALALEYEEVWLRKVGNERREAVHRALQALLTRCEWVPIRFTYRPASPDPADDLVVDCVMNSGAILVTDNVRDFRTPAQELRFGMLRPDDLLEVLETTR